MLGRWWEGRECGGWWRECDGWWRGPCGGWWSWEGWADEYIEVYNWIINNNLIMELSRYFNGTLTFPEGNSLCNNIGGKVDIWGGALTVPWCNGGGKPELIPLA